MHNDWVIVVQQATTHKRMYESIAESSVRTEAVRNFTHLYSATSEHAIMYTVVSTQPTNDAL